MSELFKSFHLSDKEYAIYPDIADTDLIPLLSDEELIERFNTLVAIRAEFYARFDAIAINMSRTFAPLSLVDPDEKTYMLGKELADVELTAKHCIAFYDTILKPFYIDRADTFYKEMCEYINKLGYELSKRRLLIAGDSIWYNFDSKGGYGWCNLGELISTKKDVKEDD